MKLNLDFKYFADSSFWLLANQIMTTLKVLIITILLTNILTQEIYGQYVFALAVLGIAVGLSQPGMPIAIVQGVARKKDGTYYAAIKLILKWSFLGIGVLLAFATYAILVGRETGFLLFLILAFVFPVYAISAQYGAFFKGKKRFRELMIWNSSKDILSILILVAVLFSAPTIIYIILATILAQSLLECFISFYIVPKYFESTAVDKKDLAYGKKVSFVSIAAVILINGEKIIIPLFDTFTGTALYALAEKIVISGYVFVKSATESFTPKLINLKKKSFSEILNKYFILLGIGVLLCLGFNIVIGPFIYLFFPTFEASIAYARGLSLLFLTIPDTITLAYIHTQRKIKTIRMFLITSIVVNLVLLIALIPFFGIWGIIMARVGSKLLSSWLMIVMIMRKSFPE